MSARLEGFTELTLRTLETRTRCCALPPAISGQSDPPAGNPAGDNSRELILSNDETIPVSRRYLRNPEGSPKG